MKIITQANDLVLEILKSFKRPNGTRLLYYALEAETEDGVLLFNLLTREMLLLSREEREEPTVRAYLQDRWFLVPEDTKEKELVDLVRDLLRARRKRLTEITGYTIFTTTDCNARCYYCYELGRSRTPMSEETAHKVARYIRDHCGGKKVRLNWYGGEPLYNPKVIDIICSDLREMGVDYFSSAISNAYLFDEAMVEKAASHWKMESLQIPLDGTEKVYNKTKAYIYKDGNPYHTVLENMQRLLDAGIHIDVRLNVSLKNAEDLLLLVDDLAERFPDKRGLYVYGAHIFETKRPMAESYSAEEWAERDQALHRLTDRISVNGLSNGRPLRKNLRTYHCMADSGFDVTVTPDGSIGLCDHFSESELIGHVDSDRIDWDTVNSWQQLEPAIPECERCFYYPQCFRLKKCAYRRICFAQLRNQYLLHMKSNMRDEYKRWQNALPQEETAEVFC